MRHHAQSSACVGDQLDAELRASITLKEESGLSYQEIAATLGISEGTVGDY